MINKNSEEFQEERVSDVSIRYAWLPNQVTEQRSMCINSNYSHTSISYLTFVNINILHNFSKSFTPAIFDLPQLTILSYFPPI